MASCSGQRTSFIADAMAQLHPAIFVPQTHVHVAVAKPQLVPWSVRRVVEYHDVAAFPARVFFVDANAAVV